MLRVLAQARGYRTAEHRYVHRQNAGRKGEGIFHSFNFFSMTLIRRFRSQDSERWIRSVISFIGASV